MWIYIQNGQHMSGDYAVLIMMMTNVDLSTEWSTYVWRPHYINNDDDKCEFIHRMVYICLEIALY